MCVRARARGAVGSKIFWYDNHVDEGEEPATTYVNPGNRPYIKLTGVGFEPRFHPDANGQFKCEFTVKGKKDKDVSPGTIKSKVSSAGSYYHVECQVPAFTKGTKVTMKLFEHDGTEIPFRGGDGCNGYEVQPLSVSVKSRSVLVGVKYQSVAFVSLHPLEAPTEGVGAVKRTASRKTPR